MTFLPNSADRVLRDRARQVIPGGMWGHMNAQALGASYPQFFDRARGARLWDVDGNEYVDLMCSWGPMVLGYRHPVVEAAFSDQTRKGDVMNGPGETLVVLAELLVSTVRHADWAMFQKNGSDATTACLTIARSATACRKVLVAKGSYHGALPWCSPNPHGITSEDRAHLIAFEYNDPDSLRQAARQAGTDLAGIILTPFRHDQARDQEMPSKEFAACARAICDEMDAVLILDDVRAGFRIDLGGSWEPIGVRPDLSAFSKAIANGYPLAAITGVDRLREAAARTFLTGSFWCGAAAMAAGIATITTLRDSNAVVWIERMGRRLRDGMDGLATRHGFALRQTGPVQMPMILFEDDADFGKADMFCAAALRGGAYFHPRHNMFLSAAHTEADIDQVLNAADDALMQMRQRGTFAA